MLQLTAATSAREEAQEKLKAEQAAHAALKVESGKLLEGWDGHGRLMGVLEEKASKTKLRSDAKPFCFGLLTSVAVPPALVARALAPAPAVRVPPEGSGGS